MASSLATSSQVGKKVSKRKEAPPINNYIKGSKKAALEVAKSDEKIMAAFADYESDCKSSGDTSHLNVKTGATFTWHGLMASVGNANRWCPSRL